MFNIFWQAWCSYSPPSKYAKDILELNAKGDLNLQRLQYFSVNYLYKFCVQDLT